MKRALLIHAGAVGDFVMALRVVAAMRQAGAEHLTVLGRPHIAALACPDDGVDEVLDIDVGGFHALFSQGAALGPNVVALLSRIDLAVDMLGAGHTTQAHLQQAGIPKVIHLDPRHRTEWPGHVSDQWLADLRAAGFDATVGPPRLHADPAPTRHLAARSVDLNTGPTAKPLVILHPGSGSTRKCWPLPNFVTLAGKLQAAGMHTRFLLGPTEAERLRDNEIAQLRTASPLMTDCSLREVANIIAAARCFVGNDCGISHLAAALETPTVAIFGPTDPNTWRPLGEHVTILRAPRPARWPTVDDVARAALGRS